jgi:hypothetical protein
MTTVRADITASFDIMTLIEAQDLDIGGLRVTLGQLFIDDDLKGLRKQIRAVVERAIAEAWKK